MRISPRLAVLLLVAACLGACCGGSDNNGGGGSDPVMADTAAPIFRGGRAIATAGGAWVRLDWRPAHDTMTPTSAIRYQIHVAATSGGHTFASPVRTTSGGATSVILSLADSPLITEGTTAYYVVRALDTDGNSDTNRVELCARPMPASSVGFVGLVSPEGPGGTLGNHNDPFPSIQPAIAACEANGGGIVVVMGSLSFARTVELDVLSTSVSAMGIYGSFPDGGSLPSGATGADILAARDFENLPTRLNRPSGATDSDLFRVDNGFAPTFIDGFVFEDLSSSERAVLGIRSDLQVSGCDMIDGGEIAFEEGVGMAEGPVQSTGARVIGVDGVIESGGFFGNFVQVDAHTGVLRVQNCTVEDASDQLRFTGGAVPVGGMDVYFTHNVAFDVDNGFDCSLDPFDSNVGGPVNIWIEDNEVRSCSSSALYVDDLSDIGENGTANLFVRRNLVVGTSYDSLELYVGPPEAGIDVNVFIEDNTFLNCDEEHVYMDLGVAANRTTVVSMQDNVLGTSESEIIYLTYSSGSTDEQDGGFFDIEIEGTVHTGGGEDIYLELPVAHGGRTDLDFVENTVLDNNDEGLYLDVDGYIGTTTGKFGSNDDGVYHLNVFNNYVSGYEPVIIDDSRNSGDGSSVFGYFGNNVMAFADDGSDTTGIDAGIDGRNCSWLFNRNFLGSGGQDTSEVALHLDTAQGGLPSEIRVLNNVMTLSSGGGIEVDSDGPQPQIINNTVAFNGLDGEEGIEANGADSQVFVHNSIVSHSGGEDVELNGDVDPTYSLIRDWVPAHGMGNMGGEPIYLTSITDLANAPLDPTLVIPAIFALAPTSPAVDAGDPDSRFNDPDGSRNDMGAYGGPCSGSMGLLPDGTEIPFVRVGVRPYAGLFTGDTFVDPNSAITFVFTGEVDVLTAPNAITVTSGGAAVPGTFTVSKLRRDLVFTPTTVLNPSGDEFVTFTMSTSLRSADGRALAWAERLDIPLDNGTVMEAEPNDVNDPFFDVNDIMAAQATGAGPGPDTIHIAGEVGVAVGTDGLAFPDVDVFSFQADAGGRIMATVSDQKGSQPVELTLYDGSANEVAAGKVDAFARDGLGGTPYLDHTVETTGTWFLVVSGGPNIYELQVVID